MGLVETAQYVELIVIGNGACHVDFVIVILELERFILVDLINQPICFENAKLCTCENEKLMSGTMRLALGQFTCTITLT